MTIPRLESERLLLREWKENDIALFADMNSDADVMRFFPAFLSASESERFAIKSNSLLREKQMGLWATELKRTGEFIGFIGLANPSFEAPFTPCTEIGWRLAKEYWGQGYATEGARRVLQYAFNDLHLNEVVSFTSLLNVSSIKVMERLGMKRDVNEDFDHPRIEKGHRLERHVLYRLKRAEA